MYQQWLPGIDTYWRYTEEADFSIDKGYPEPPTWQCPKCYKETHVRKLR